MVRVISVHNFLKQDITSVDEVLNLAAVPPNILLLVQSDHTISVKDLSLINDPGYSVPTVDQVIKIVYSVQGNYIGTLERKLTRNGIEVCYTRIYLNWESLRNYEEFPPMRARIAGRVTPLSQNHEGLEMIEIPAHNMPDNIACCPISGNLLLSSKNTISIYRLKIEMHDISKMHFVDFEQLSVEFLLSFVPTRIQFVENVIAAQNDEFLHVFRVLPNLSVHGCDSADRDISSDDLENLHSSSHQNWEKHGTINYEKLLRENREMRARQLLRMSSKYTGLSRAGTEEDGLLDSRCDLAKINPLSFPVRHDFPTISLQKPLESKRVDIHKQNPFLAGQDLIVNVISTNMPENCRIQCKIENIFQYQLLPLMLGSTTNRELQEKFTCLILKPYYCSEKESALPRQSLLESDNYSQLKTMACFFGTQQEGYLHCFDCDAPNKEDCLGSYVVYPFTAPVVEVRLEDSFVHALTDSGLETYTMRGAQFLMKNNDETASPSSDDPVCLVGLRPFVNVMKLCLTNNYLILFANNEESSSGMWTLYKLNLPHPSCVWHDFLAVAEENRWEAPATYSHMVGEGHLVLKTALNCVQWVSHLDETGNHLYSPAPLANSRENALTEKLYKESCALLGDFHMLNEDFQKSSNYYRMCGYKITEIVRRIQMLTKNVPEKFKDRYDDKTVVRGLIYHLKKMLSFYDGKYSFFAGNREEFYSPEIGGVVNFLLDYMEKEGNASVSDLILDSAVLREFSTDRILKMMKNILSKSSPPQDKDALSLALMCIQRDQNEQAKTVLLTMNAERLRDLLQQYHHLLFEKNHSTKAKSFTELSMVLIETYPTVVGSILSHLVAEKRALNLTKLLKIFLEILPSGTVQSKNSSIVLQIVLESYFKSYFGASTSKKCDFKAAEALKILIRIYLTFLKQRAKLGREKDDHRKEAEEEILFLKCRPSYLNQMPPFGTDINDLLSPKHDAAATGDNSAEKDLKNILLKIQSLLSYENLPMECVTEVRNYINKQPNVYGSLSLQALSAANVQEGVHLLINFAPQSVIQYTKDCIKDIDSWKFAIRQIQIKINTTNDDSRKKFYYQHILTEILLYGAKNLEIEELVDILPRDLEDGEKYLSIAQNNAQAKHIRTLIMTTGKQLQATLYDTIPDKNGQVHN